MNYLNAYVEVFIMPKIRALRVIPTEFNIDITYLDETSKRTALFDLLIAVGLYRDQQHQWISDEDDAICEELESLIRETSMPIIDVPIRGRHKLYYDLTKLQVVLDRLSEHLQSNEMTYFIKEIGQCIPHTALHYELLLTSGKIKVYYNRLKRLISRLDTAEFDCDTEDAVKREILLACQQIDIIGDEEPIEISDDKHEFMIQWKLKEFDNQSPEALYPPQNMYRNTPYRKGEPDGWLFANRSQLKYMNGDVYWRKSPVYLQIEASARFAFYNYSNIIESNNDYSYESYKMPPIRKWSLTNIPVCPESHVVPNNAFKTYYNEIVSDFCQCVESSNEDRTDMYLSHIYTQASKIRAMSEWMVHGIDNVSVDAFILLSSLEPVSGVYIDFSYSPYVLYRKLIDYFAYVVCVNDQDEKKKVINALKMCENIVSK